MPNINAKALPLRSLSSRSVSNWNIHNFLVPIRPQVFFPFLSCILRVLIKSSSFVYLAVEYNIKINNWLSKNRKWE